MSKAENAVPQDRRLTLAEVVDGLLADGLAEAELAEKFKRERRYFRGDIHPLVVIAEQRWKTPGEPPRTLDLDALTEWLARWSRRRLGI